MPGLISLGACAPVDVRHDHEYHALEQAHKGENCPVAAITPFAHNEAECQCLIASTLHCIF
eukprot:scaffold201320_cov36-Prasinocladus_malaysianus.AAC.3